MSRDLRHVIDALQAGVVVVDRAGRVEELNPQASRFLRVPAEAVLGAPLERLAPVPVPRFIAPPAALGRRIQEQLVDLLAAEKIRPVVGGTWSFADLPQALEAMESRTTIGRIVIDR